MRRGKGLGVRAGALHAPPLPAATLGPDALLLGCAGWREWLGGSLCIFGGAWLAGQGLPAVAGVPLLLIGLHFFCRRDDMVIDARGGRYRRRLGYVWHCREWQGSVDDLALAVRAELDEARSVAYGLELLSLSHPQAALRLGVYPTRQAALAEARPLAERLGLPFANPYTPEDLP